jgi:glutamate synthase (NADPH/NADH) large chain
MEMVAFDPLDSEDEELLRTMIKDHQLLTGSELAAHVLSYWPKSFKQFIKVMPIDYKVVLLKKKEVQMVS